MEIEIQEPLLGQLLIQAAVQEVSAEEIVERAIQNYMEGDESDACG